MFGIVRAPELDMPGLTWFNTDRPLTLAGLRGRMVILDFWTFCCINCIQIVPTLRRIENTFPQAVTVIGVHSPKFTAERCPNNLSAAVSRYNIRHPIVHDPDMMLWKRYAVKAWPTLVFITPDGRIAGQFTGEPDPDAIVNGIGMMLKNAQRQGSLRPTPMALAEPPAHEGALHFPGKIKPIVGARGTREWAVASGGQHQIVILDEQGQTVQRIGSGKPGFEDGPLASAEFNSPQGLVAGDGAVFYVADTGNHALRQVDLASGIVTTLAGSGFRGQPLTGRRYGEAVDLASPWDLERQENRLFFANAGTHQIGIYHLGDGLVEVLAGTGEENIVDGPAGKALLAQPSGLALDPQGRGLYFTDSETSALRVVWLDGDPHVETLIGSGLFDFGDRDGDCKSAALQHPLGVAWHQDGLLVADSYNHRIKQVNLGCRSVIAFPKGGEAGKSPPLLTPSEPAGIASRCAKTILLSDTNNHRILEYRLDTGTRRVFAA